MGRNMEPRHVSNNSAACELKGCGSARSVLESQPFPVRCVFCSLTSSQKKEMFVATV